jgi:hypothetical protein
MPFQSMRPTTVERVRAPGPRRIGGALVLAVVFLWSTGCGGELPPPDPPSSSSPAPTPTGPVSIPADGATLRSFGYTFGPVEQFSLPRSSVISAAVDQANNLTAVLSAPPAGEVAAYLRRALPAAGFTIAEDDPGALTLTFTGHGWRGSFTGNSSASALLLRPV